MNNGSDVLARFDRRLRLLASLVAFGCCLVASGCGGDDASGASGSGGSISSGGTAGNGSGGSAAAASGGAAGSAGTSGSAGGNADGGTPDGSSSTAVNFSVYGASGDGASDDTAQLQAALDAEGDLIAAPGATFRISATLKINQAFAHTINWNGATVVTTAALQPMILIDKRSSNGGLTTMRSLLVDGNKKATHGVDVNSRVTLTDVDATGFRQPTSSSPAGFRINLYDDPNAHGTWSFDGCDVNDIVGTSNGITTDSLGAANGYLIYWKAVPKTKITLDVKNATVRDCWGEDAQNVAIFSPGLDISGSSSGTVWTNMTFLDWERRAIKGFAGNNTFKKCSFTDPDPTNPKLYSSNKSGMVVVGPGSGATGADNQVFENCSFNQAGYDGRVIVSDTANVYFRNCTWTGGSDLLFTSFGAGGVGKVEVCSGTFGKGSTVGDYGGITYKGNDVISLDTDNTYVETNYVTVSPSYYQEVNLSCAP